MVKTTTKKSALEESLNRPNAVMSSVRSFLFLSCFYRVLSLPTIEVGILLRIYDDPSVQDRRMDLNFRVFVRPVATALPTS